MTKKIFKGTLLTCLIVIFACTALVMGAMYDYLGNKMDQELKNQALIVRAALETYGADCLPAMEKDHNIESRITLIDSEGKVLFDNMADSSEMSNHMERSEVKEALAEGEGFAVRRSDTLSMNTRYYAIRLSDGSILRMASTHYTRLALVMDNKGMLVLITAAATALSVAVSIAVSRRIVKPINEIDLDEPDIGESYEELGPLLHRIRAQNARIEAQMKDLKKQQEEFALITDSMNEGLITVDGNARILSCNGSAIRLLGAESSVGDTVLSLNRSAAFREAVEKALAGEQTRTLMKEEGRTLEIIADPVTASADEVKGAVIIIMDVTDREQAEELRKEFTSNVSHELKTPLTSIYGISDMMAEGLVKPGDVKQFSVTLREEAARLISLTEDVIKLSRLDENSVAPDSEDIDVLAAAEKAAARLSEKAHQHGVSLSTGGNGGSIYGSATVLDEIIQNLADNAIKYNKEGGSVRIEVNSKKDACILTVEDTGIGIPAKDLPRVFERFYRVDKSHSRETGGTGLGLSIVKHAAAYLGGAVDIESREGQGTKVTVSFRAV